MNIIGRFYFKQTKNSNLIGEYSNNDICKIISESADLVSKMKEKFTGTYNSTWKENDKAELLNLIIEFKPKTENSIYKLSWKERKTRKTIFFGEGFIVDNILIGDYRNFE